MKEEETECKYKEKLVDCMKYSGINQETCSIYLVTAGHHSNHDVATEHLPIFTQSLSGLEFGLEYYNQKLRDESRHKGY